MANITNMKDIWIVTANVSPISVKIEEFKLTCISNTLLQLLKLTCPGAITPGHQKIPGTLIPPSKVVDFEQRNGPELPPFQ